MSLKYEKFLQEQINKLDIEIAQLKGLVKSLLDAVHDNSCRIEHLDNLVFERGRLDGDTKDNLDVSD